MSARRALIAALLAAGCAHQGNVTPLPATIPAAAGAWVDVPLAYRYLDVKTGSGTVATPMRCYYAHYTGWLASNGFRFQSSHDTNARGEVNTPFAFAQGWRRVIAGWDAGFGGMRVGGVRRLYIPYQMAYGDAGQASGHIPGRTDLVFDVELLGIHDTVATADSNTVRTLAGNLPGQRPWCLRWSDLPPEAKQ